MEEEQTNLRNRVITSRSLQTIRLRLSCLVYFRHMYYRPVGDKGDFSSPHPSSCIAVEHGRLRNRSGITQQRTKRQGVAQNNKPLCPFLYLLGFTRTLSPSSCGSRFGYGKLTPS